MSARGASTVVELGGQGPLALSPRVAVSPSPSCPLMFQPQHLTAVSFCSEKHPRVTDRLRISIDKWGSHSPQGIRQADYQRGAGLDFI